jgi:hypothetical protein
LKRPYLINPLVDRIMEFGRPAGWPYLFEGIRTQAEFRDYGNQLRRLARTHFGWAGPEFARRLELWMQEDLPAVQAFIAERHEAYYAAAENIESSAGRDVGRVSNRFATLYATGCLAIRLKIFPFTEAEVLEALLTCHRDHVAFIDQQLKILAWSTPALIRNPAPPMPQEPINGAPVVPGPTPFDRLRRFINGSRQHGFIDLHNLTRIGLEVRLRARQSKPVLGYLTDGEYWILGDRFEQVAGSARDALALKRELFGRGLIETTQRGHSVSYVVKRSLPDGSRPFFVVIRHRAKKP